MSRPVLSLAAIATLAVPAAAANYSATLATAASGRIVARDINWTCGADGCQGATAESRPAVLCQALAKQTGRIETFMVDGRALSEPELAKCNSAAKAGASRKLAAQ